MSTEERAQFTLNGVDYYTDSIPENAIGLFGNVELIDNQIKTYQNQIEVASIAKQTFVKSIEAFVDDFEKVPTE